jgi:hypothetical protein
MRLPDNPPARLALLLRMEVGREVALIIPMTIPDIALPMKRWRSQRLCDRIELEP